MEFCALKTCLIVYLDRTYIKWYNTTVGFRKCSVGPAKMGFLLPYGTSRPRYIPIIYIFLYLKGENHNEINRHCQKD